MRPTSEQVIRQIYQSRAAGQSTSSLSENNHSSFSHVPETGMRELRTSHYFAPSVKRSRMDKRLESKQSSKPSRCLRCGFFSHYWRDCDVDSGNDLVKQRADQFLKVKKASDKRESDKREGKNKKRYKANVISGDTPADNLMSLIDYSNFSKVSALVL